MQLEVLQFLIKAHQHLYDARPAADEPVDDLQAVERTLPDADWFEREEYLTTRHGADVRWERDHLSLNF